METTVSLLPAIVSSTVKPKPSKTEIIGALVQLRITEMRDENVVIEKRRKMLKEKIDRQLLKIFKANYATHAHVYSVGYSDTFGDIEVKIGGRGIELPVELKAMILEWRKLTTFRIDAKRIESEIRNGLSLRGSTNNRIKAMLESPESNAALTKILDTLTGKTAKTIET